MSSSVDRSNRRAVFGRRSALTAAPGLLLALMFSGCTPSNEAASTSPPAQTAEIQFKDVAAASGVAFRLSHEGRTPLDILETIGHGCAWIDFDADDLLDLVFTGPDQVRLYRNGGAGKFTDVTAEQGLDVPGYWIAAAVGDYDNDGWPDLLLNGYHCRALLRNRGGKGFENVTAAVGLAEVTGWGASAAFTDLDRDGYLDLVMGRYAEFGPETRRFCDEDGVQVMCAPRTYPKQPPVVYRNLQGRRFADQTKALGFGDTAGRTIAVIPFDFDDDGWMDIYLANDTEPGDLMRNLEGKRFENVALRSGVALSDNGKPLAGMGLDAQDYDGDGRLDLALTTFEREPKPLWRNVGGGQFEDRGSAAGLDEMRGLLSWGVGLVDFDNDSWHDLLYANGHVFAKRSYGGHQYAQPLRLYRNLNGEFTDVTAALDPGVRAPLVARGSAFGDYDNDGRVDVAISNLEGQALLLHNESPRAGHWLSLKLVGRKSNRMGLGARVTVRAGEKKWIAEAKTARSVYSASDARIHFGLGAADRVDQITVRWPSGKTSTLAPEAVDRTIVVTEPNP